MYAARASGGATAGSRQNLAHAGGGYTSRPSLDPSHVHSHSDQGGEERGMVSVRSQERIELKKRTSNYNSEYNAQNCELALLCKGPDLGPNRLLVSLS